MTMPWFLVHTGHIRAWTLLHRFDGVPLPAAQHAHARPRAAGRASRLLTHLPAIALARVRVQDGRARPRLPAPQFSGVRDGRGVHLVRTCRYLDQSHRWLGSSPTRTATRTADAYGLAARAGLQGSNYQATPSRCFPQGPELNRTRAWFWHLDSKPECISANARMGEEILGAAGSRRWQANPSCCYGWVDIAYIPRRAHQAFRKASFEAFWKVQLEVAMPTIFHAMEVRPAISSSSNSSTAAIQHATAHSSSSSTAAAALIEPHHSPLTTITLPPFRSLQSPPGTSSTASADAAPLSIGRPSRSTTSARTERI